MGADLDPPEPAPPAPPDGLPSLPPSAPVVPPPDPIGTRPPDAVPPSRDPSQAELTVADRMATRNVPVTRPHIDYGLPTAPEAARAAEHEEFVRPDLVSMGPSTTALLVGRGLMVIAALLVGIAARRSTGSGGAERGERFWPVAVSAGVFLAVAIVGLVFWSVSLAENARRLQTKTASPRAVALGWALPVAWVVVSALTYLQVDVDGDLDPLPGVAGVGFAIVLAVAYARVQGQFRALSRRPPVVWLSAYPLDLIAFGLLWWRLTSWPDPVTGPDWDHVRLTGNIAFGAAAALAVNALVFGWLAQRGGGAVYERLGRLEARHQGEEAARPEWFAHGLQVRTQAAPVDSRPLMDVRPLSAIVAGFHGLWAISMVALAVVLVRTAFEYSGEPVFIDGTLFIDDDDAERLGAVASTVIIIYVLAIIVHGVWSVITALNARRVTVHAPNPGSFGIIFVPMPVLVVTGLLIGGGVGRIVIGVGLLVAFIALLRVNQMLMTLSGRLGGELRGFSQWTLFIAVAYFIGVVENFLFGRAVGRLGFLGTATLVQGVLIGIGAFVGYRAMRGLDEALRSHRQTRRADS